MRYLLFLSLVVFLSACNSGRMQAFEESKRLRETATVSNSPKAQELKTEYKNQCLEKYKNAKEGASAYCTDIKVYQDVEGGYFVEHKIDFKKINKTR